MKYFPLLVLLLLAVPIAVADTATMGSSALRSVTDEFRGIHNSGYMGAGLRVDANGDNTLDTARDYLRDRSLWEETDALVLRSDIDGNNLASTCSTTTESCTWGTSGQYSNISHYISETAYAASIGGIKIWTLESPYKEALADVDYKCNYGVSFAWGNCGWQNNTLAAVLNYQFLNDVGCFDSAETVCWTAFENEPYGDSFLYPNGTCQDRTDYIIAAWPEWYTKMRELNSSIPLVSPSFTHTDINSCGQSMFVAFIGNFTVNGAYAPDYLDVHPYSSAASGAPEQLYTRYKELYDIADAAGYGSRMITTESNVNSISMTENNQSYLVPALVQIQMKVLKETDTYAFLWYEWSKDSADGVGSITYSALYHAIENINSTGNVFATFNALNRTAAWGAGNVYNCTTSSSNTDCVIIQNGDTLTITAANLAPASTFVNVTVSGYTVNSATDYFTSSPLSTTSTTVYIPLEAYEVNTATVSVSGKRALLFGGKIAVVNGRVVIINS